MRLFDAPRPPVERCCATCAHSAVRHGRVARGTYPLVCLLKACAVPGRFGALGRANDYPCRMDFDEDGPFPRGWAPMEGDQNQPSPRL